MKYVKPIIIAATLLTSTAAFSQVVQPDYPLNFMAAVAPTQSPVNPALVNTGAVRPWDKDGHPAFVSYDAPRPTRTAVVHDSREWQASGLAKLAAEGEPQYATPAYQQRLARYHQAEVAGSGE